MPWQSKKNIHKTQWKKKYSNILQYLSVTEELIQDIPHENNTLCQQIIGQKKENTQGKCCRTIYNYCVIVFDFIAIVWELLEE